MLIQLTIGKVPSIFTNTNRNCKSFDKRLKCGIVQFLILGFASISIVCLESVHCIEINSKWFLYKQADTVECYQGWQQLMFVVIVAWVVSFPLALYIGVVMLRLRSITPNEFLFSLFFPPSIGLFLVRALLSTPNKSGKPIDVAITTEIVSKDEIDLAKVEVSERLDGGAERLALLAVVNLPFRRYPQRCDDNKDDYEDIDAENEEKEKFRRKLVWEPVLVFRRLVLLIVSIFIVNPIFKLYPVGILLVLFGFHDYMVQPFADHLLNKLQMISYGLLFVLTLISSFWAFSDNLDLTENPSFQVLGQFLLYFELLINILPFIVFIGWILQKAFLKLLKTCLRKQD